MPIDLDGAFSGDGERLTVGSELDGRYRIVGPVGGGGMGQVFEAEQVRLARRVAIKVLRPQFAGSPELRKRFEREARAMAQINSERVVKIFDCGVAPNGEPYLVMEYLHGQSLRRLLQAEGPLSAPRAARVLHDVCLGVAAAHAKGVIHRDLKPENLVVVRGDDGTELCKVLDFGLAKLRSLSSSEVPTRIGVPLGTLHYMSPEQARGDEDLDERTDVYGACAVMYEMLTGRRPHDSGSAHSLIYKIIHDDPTPIEQVGVFVPSGLAFIIQQGLQRDRAARPATVQALARSLEPFVGMRGRPAPSSSQVSDDSFDGHTKPAALVQRPAPPASRPAASRLGVLALVGIGIAGILVWVSGLRSPSATAPRPAVDIASVTTPATVLAAPTSTPSTPNGPAKSEPTSSLNATWAVGHLKSIGAESTRVKARPSVTPPPPPSANGGSSATGYDSPFVRSNPYD